LLQLSVAAICVGTLISSGSILANTFTTISKETVALTETDERKDIHTSELHKLVLLEHLKLQIQKEEMFINKYELASRAVM
jgi:hypothetical protein